MNLCVFLLFAFLPALEPRLVRTSYGFLEGMPIKSIKNTTCWIFKGVPFAQPPVGELRFKLPIPPKPWEGVRSAKQYSAACLTNSSTAMNQAERISEDCLYMNIFASERCRSGIVSCPVIFYIHGGALYKGSAIMFDDKYITDRYSSKDIVFVTTAFRLGFFGVLAFETDDIVPRNLALYDIISGLNFTHSEIAAFGGDPTRVTVMGHSQGGSIAMILAVSSIVDPDKRLFQRLIATSPALNYINSTIRGDLTWRVAYEVGCTKSAKRPHPTPLVELGRVVDCLRSVNAFDLLARQRSLEDNEKLLFDGVLFAPPFVRNDTLFRDFLSDCTPRPMMCSSTRDEFNFQKSDDAYDIGAFLMVAHPTEVRDKYYEDKKSGKIKDAYLTQVVFTLNVMFGSRFVEKGSDVYLMEYSQEPFSFHSADVAFFNGRNMKEFDENEKIIDNFYEESILNFVYGKEPYKGWSSFNPRARNYFSVKANLDKDIRPIEKLNYHSSVVDYWLHNITSFDSSVSKGVYRSTTGIAFWTLFLNILFSFVVISHP